MIPEGATRVAFLDRYGRFAKSDDEVTTVRFYAADCTELGDIDTDEYDALTQEERDSVDELGSAAGCVNTAGKSNA